MKKEDIKLIWRCLVIITQLLKDSGLIVKVFIVRDLLDNTDLCQKQVQRTI